VCVCCLLYLSFYLCCARCVFCVLFYIPNCLLFFFFFSTNFIDLDTYVTVLTDVRITLRICLKYIFHLHLHFSNSCVCVSKHVYAFPSSFILIHIYYHIHEYVLCPVLCLSSYFGFLSSFSINLIDTYITVHIDVSITPLICLDSFPSTSSFLTSLPPHVHLCLHPKYIHISLHPQVLLFEPLLPLCVLLRVNSCGCVPKHVYAFPSSSIFIHTYRHPHMYGLGSVLCLSPSFCFLSSVSTNFIDTYVTVPIDIRTTCSYAYPLFHLYTNKSMCTIICGEKKDKKKNE